MMSSTHGVILLLYLPIMNQMTSKMVSEWKLFYTGSLSEDYPDDEYFSFSSIGRSTGNTSYFYAKSFHGKIQDVRIYNRVLTDEEIKILYNMKQVPMQIHNNTIYLSGELKME